MSKGFLVSEETPDRKYFTIVPNYIINHSTIWERDLYLFMKRVAGENGLCFASHQTLAEMSGVSRPTISRTIGKLLKRGWIKEIGVRQAKTHPVKEYQIVDLWRKNTEFYEKQEIRKPQNTSFEKIRKPQNQRYVKKHIVEEDPMEEDIKKNAPGSKPDIVQSLLKEDFTGGRITTEHQYFGLEIYAKLKAPENKKSECIRIARDYPRERVISAYSFAADYPQEKLRWKMFLWKLNKLNKDGKPN